MDNLDASARLSLGLKKERKRFWIAFAIIASLAVIFFLLELFVGYSSLSLGEAFLALFGKGEASAIRIMQRIRLPRALAAALVGGGLGLAGLMMQTSLSNPMASPGTLGVSNAAVLGANIAIILLSDDPVNGTNWYIDSPYAVACVAFVSALASTLLVLLLGRLRRISPTSMILIGVGLGAAYQAITTLIQFFAVDHSLVSAVYWSFGDIGRANYLDLAVMAIIVIGGFIVLMFLSPKYDALMLGDKTAETLGIHVMLMRIIGLFIASLITATIVALCGIIGFIGIVAPHICRRIVGSNHRKLIPVTMLMGIILVSASDFLGGLISKASALPVGAVTALLGAPFFVILMLSRKEMEK